MAEDGLLRERDAKLVAGLALVDALVFRPRVADSDGAFMGDLYNVITSDGNLFTIAEPRVPGEAVIGIDVDTPAHDIGSGW